MDEGKGRTAFKHKNPISTSLEKSVAPIQAPTLTPSTELRQLRAQVNLEMRRLADQRAREERAAQELEKPAEQKQESRLPYSIQRLILTARIFGEEVKKFDLRSWGKVNESFLLEAAIGLVAESEIKAKQREKLLREEIAELSRSNEATQELVVDKLGVYEADLRATLRRVDSFEKNKKKK